MNKLVAICSLDENILEFFVSYILVRDAMSIF